MSERDFNMVSPAVWGSERFAALPTPAKLSFMYLLTSPHQNSAGGYRLPAAYAAADMGCEAAEFTTALKAITDAGLAIYDDATKEVYLTGWFKHCPPTNQKHAKGTMKIISRIGSDMVREAMEAEFTATEWGRSLSPPQQDGIPEGITSHSEGRPYNRLVDALNKPRGVGAFR